MVELREKPNEVPKPAQEVVRAIIEGMNEMVGEALQAPVDDVIEEKEAPVLQVPLKRDEFPLEELVYVLSSAAIGFVTGYGYSYLQRPGQIPHDKGKCGLSIVIPTLNEEKHIGPLLESIAMQDFEPKEVVIVDGFSTDKTKATAEKFKNWHDITFIEEKGRQAHAQNVGAKAAKYRHILFMDADVVLPGKDYLTKLMTHTHKEGIAHASALTKQYDEDSFPVLVHDSFVGGAIDAGQTVNIYLNLIDFAYFIYIDRNLFALTGGFKDDLPIAQGTDFVDRCPIKPACLPKELAVFTSDRRCKGIKGLETVIELLRANLMVKLGHTNFKTAYWGEKEKLQPSIGIGPGEHFRMGNIHARVEGGDAFVHLDKVAAHTDPLGHLWEDVFKAKHFR